jgi:hypothetical protein
MRPTPASIASAPAMRTAASMRSSDSNARGVFLALRGDADAHENGDPWMHRSFALFYGILAECFLECQTLFALFSPTISRNKSVAMASADAAPS